MQVEDQDEAATMDSQHVSVFLLGGGPGGESPAPASGDEIQAEDETATMDSAFMLQDEVTALVMNTLAGNGRAYARERRSAAKKLVCEVFSPPRLTNVLSKFPS